MPVHLDTRNCDSWGVSKVINLGDQRFNLVHSHSDFRGGECVEEFKGCDNALQKIRLINRN
jgi:hypothetical protein